MDKNVKACMGKLSIALKEAVEFSKKTDSPAQLRSNLDNISLLVTRGFNQLEIMMKNDTEQRQFRQSREKFKRQSAKMDDVPFI